MRNQAQVDIEDFKPVFDSIQTTKAVFQTSSVTYNETGLTYNTFSSVYGGSDRVSDSGPNIKEITNI